MDHRTIFGWLLIGLVAGVFGKSIMPGKDPGGFIVTILIGIAGALLVGFTPQSMGVVLIGGCAARFVPRGDGAPRTLDVWSRYLVVRI